MADTTAASRRQHFVAAVFILFNAATYFFIQYDKLRGSGPGLEGWIQKKLAGTYSEGDQYRIAVPYLAHFIELHTHIRPEQSVPLIDFLCYGLGLTLLYMLLRSSPLFETAGNGLRVAMLGFFFAASQFPILWIFPYQHVETLPTMFYLAAITLLIVRSDRMPFAVVCLLAALLSFGQGLARTDAPLVVGLGTMAAAAMNVPFRRSRSAIATLGLLCSGVAAGTQLYLRHLIPNRSTDQTQNTLQLFRNLDLLHPPFHIPIFLTAMLPFTFSLYLLRRYRLPLDSADKLVLLICLIYLPIYLTFGIMGEIRIFVPYLFLAAGTMAKVCCSFLMNPRATTEPESEPLLA